MPLCEDCSKLANYTAKALLADKEFTSFLGEQWTGTFKLSIKDVEESMRTCWSCKQFGYRISGDGDLKESISLLNIDPLVTYWFKQIGTGVGLVLEVDIRPFPIENNLDFHWRTKAWHFDAFFVRGK